MVDGLVISAGTEEVPVADTRRVAAICCGEITRRRRAGGCIWMPSDRLKFEIRDARCVLQEIWRAPVFRPLPDAGGGTLGR